MTTILGIRHHGPGSARSVLAELESVASELKRLCGSGGSVKDGAVELQGDHGEKVAAHLAARGLRVR